MIDPRKKEEIAVQRMQLLSPLLEEGLDEGKARQLKAQICERTGLSDRTLRRYLAGYKAEGFAGLKPREKRPRKSAVAVPPEILDQAILLRREVPGRSVDQIIRILEWEGRIQPGQVKRTTLQDRFMERGFSARHMKMYAETGIAARRFQQRHRNRLWHSDIKFGPYLPINKDGTMRQVYLVTFFDDATRFVLHGEFYPVLDQVIVEDCLRKALQKYGLPESVYFDNGRQYRTKWMTRTCAKLGIRLLFAKPYSPEATGKIERFNRVVDAFLDEAKLARPKTLEEFNKLFHIWLDECYQNKPHSALENNVSPEAAWRGDSKPIKFADPDVLANAFLYCEDRKVDKVGCISFNGKKYEVGLTLIGCTVDVIYDPHDTSELTIEYENHPPRKAKQLIIGERSGPRPTLPDRMQPQPAEFSRLLTAAAERNRQRIDRQIPAISYRKVHKDGEGGV